MSLCESKCEALLNWGFKAVISEHKRAADSILYSQLFMPAELRLEMQKTFLWLSWEQDESKQGTLTQLHLVPKRAACRKILR